MKNFSFRLDRVLQLRVSAEQEQARRVAEARRGEVERREALEACAARVIEAMDQLAATPHDLRTAGTLSNLNLVVEAARALSAAAATEHRESLARLEAELTSFDEARKARRALERLREQRQEVWGREVERVEQQRVDEIALRMSRGQEVAG